MSGHLLGKYSERLCRELCCIAASDRGLLFPYPIAVKDVKKGCDRSEPERRKNSGNRKRNEKRLAAQMDSNTLYGLDHDNADSTDHICSRYF